MSPCKFHSVFRYKDTLKKKIQSDIGFRYACCNYKVTYYGKTYHHFFTRAVESIGISNLTGKRLKSVKKSAVSDHPLEWNCSIDFGHFDAQTNSNFLLRNSHLSKLTSPSSTKPSNHFRFSYLIKTFVAIIPPCTGLLLG